MFHIFPVLLRRSKILCMQTGRKCKMYRHEREGSICKRFNLLHCMRMTCGEAIATPISSFLFVSLNLLNNKKRNKRAHNLWILLFGSTLRCPIQHARSCESLISAMRLKIIGGSFSLSQTPRCQRQHTGSRDVVLSQS